MIATKMHMVFMTNCQDVDNYLKFWNWLLRRARNDFRVLRVCRAELLSCEKGNKCWKETSHVWTSHRHVTITSHHFESCYNSRHKFASTTKSGSTLGGKVSCSTFWCNNTNGLYPSHISHHTSVIFHIKLSF